MKNFLNHLRIYKMSKPLIVLTVIHFWVPLAFANQLPALYESLDVEESTILYMFPQVINTKRIAGLTCSRYFNQDENGLKISEYSYDCSFKLSALNYGILYSHLNVEEQRLGTSTNELEVQETYTKTVGGLMCIKILTTSHKGLTLNEQFDCSLYVGPLNGSQE